MSVMPLPADGQSARHVVAAEVRAELARQRRTGAELARVLHMSAAAVSRRTTGELAFDVDELAAAAAFLNVPISQLLGLRPAPPTAPRGGQPTEPKVTGGSALRLLRSDVALPRPQMRQQPLLSVVSD